MHSGPKSIAIKSVHYDASKPSCAKALEVVVAALSACTDYCIQDRSPSRVAAVACLPASVPSYVLLLVASSCPLCSSPVAYSLCIRSSCSRCASDNCIASASSVHLCMLPVARESP